MLIEDLLDRLSSNLWGRTRSEAIEQGICVRCGDSKQGKEFAQNALCQECLEALLDENPPEGESQ